MTAMARPGHHIGARASVRAALAAVTALAVLIASSGCSTGDPRPIASSELAEAQTFPYYRVYWVGRSFEGHALAAADGLRGYIERIGTSVYYGNCVKSKGIFGGGTCELPLQVTTVIYRLHSNAPLGPQRKPDRAGRAGDRLRRRPLDRDLHRPGRDRRLLRPLRPTPCRRPNGSRPSTRRARRRATCRLPSTAPACRDRSGQSSRG